MDQFEGLFDNIVGAVLSALVVLETYCAVLRAKSTTVSGIHIWTSTSMAPSYRRLIKIFLGSPSDLNPERQIAQRVVGEINQDFSDYWQIQVELVGWEATLPGYGRPQEIINADLDQCEHFIGMLWKWWGSKPATSGRFTSGFEEEFQRSIERRRTDGHPEITLLFKDIDEADKRDPGESLKKVLEFRDSIVSTKEILYSTFVDAQQFESKFRSVVIGYVQKILRSERTQDTPQSKSETVESTANSTGDLNKVPLFQESATTFLMSLVLNENGANETSATDAARFRLLGTVIPQSGTDQELLGAHDANILFRYRDQLKLTTREILGLIDCGLANLANENVPLWNWLGLKDTFDFNPLFFRSIFGDDDVKAGALSALTLLGKTLAPVMGNFNREELFKSLLIEASDNKLKLAVLSNLRSQGTVVDTTLLEEFLKNPEPALRSNAENTLIAILSRAGKDSAFSKLFELNSESIDDETASALFSNATSIRTVDLKRAATYRSVTIRQAAVHGLEERSEFDLDIARTLIGDPNVALRLRALIRLTDAGERYSSDQAKKILIKPKNPFGGGLLMGAGRGTDEEGQKAFDWFEVQRLKKLDTDELERLIEASSPLDWNADLAMFAKHPKAMEKKFREAIEDGFSSLFDQKNFRTAHRLGDGSIVRQTGEIKEFVLAKIIRRALELYCNNSRPGDIDLVRSTIDRGTTDYSPEAVRFLAKHGDWSDVKRVVRHAEKINRIVLFPTYEENAATDRCADAIVRLGKHRVRDIFDLDLSTEMRWRILRKIPQRSFVDVANNLLMSMFSDESATTRKVASLKAIECLSQSAVRELLRRYLHGDDNRYYNVIHWLDFGASMPSGAVKKAATLMLSRL